MQEIRSSNPPVFTGICDPNNSRARHHRKKNLFGQKKAKNFLELNLSKNESN